MEKEVSKLFAGIQRALSNPLTDDVSIDPMKQLHEILAVTGHNVEGTGGKVEFIGRDPIVASPWPLATMGAVAMMAKAVAMADLWRIRTGESQDLSIDLRKMPHRLCPFYDRKWELLNGFAPGAPSDPMNPFTPLNMYRTADGRWMQFVNMYPKARRAALAFFETNDSREAITAAVEKWTGSEIEEAANAAGFQATMIRTVEQFMAEEQFAFLSGTDIVQIEKIGDSDPVPFSDDPNQPLDGIRALGLSHVIAGPALGRAMACHGADVINVWRPSDFEIDFLYYSSNVGMRSALVDIDQSDGLSQLVTLLKEADVFFTNRRPGFTARYGLTAHELAALKPASSMWKCPSTEASALGKIASDSIKMPAALQAC